jgi:tetratricopeptide (TPR) repeat protein
MNWRKLCFLVLAGFLMLALPASPALCQAKVDLGIITVKQRDLAEKLRSRLLKGDSFETLAKANSVGPASFRGGRLGKVPYSRLRSEYRAALEGLAPGKPSKVIPTEEGYTILMRFDRASSSDAPSATSRRQAKQETSFRFTTKAPAMDASPKSALDLPPLSPKVAGPLPEAAYLVARRKVLAGVEALMAGQFQNAEKDFSQALGENPREDSAAFLLEMTRQGLAGKVKKKAIRLFAQGFQAVTEGDGSAALEYFLKCKDVDPDFWQGELFAANMLAGQGKLAEAKRLIKEQVLTRNPRSVRAYVTLGLMAADEKKPNQARQYLEKAIQLNPDFPQAHYELGMVALYGNDLKVAERQFKQTVVLDPYNDQGYNNLGLVYAFTKRPALAERMYKKALALNPSYPDAHVNLGNLYASQRKLNQALDEYVKALAIDPKFAPAFSNLAGVYALKKDWPEAIKAADRALEMGHRVPQSLLNVLAPHRKQKKK